MNDRSGWIQEFWRIIVVIILALMVGAVFEQITLVLLLALLAYTFRNLFNLQRLTDWLDDPQINKIPIHFGMWGDIYSIISRFAARQAQRERRLPYLTQR